MSDLSKIIANLPPEKRAEMLAQLKSGSRRKEVISEINLSKNFAYRFNSDQPFDFSVEPTEVKDPDSGCVQVRAKASSLNFRDVMIASKLYPASPGVPSNMGSDYAGIIEKVGEGVTDFKTGDEVIALHIGHVEDGEVRDNCHFIQTFNVFEECVCHKPENLSFVEAACIPTVFLTAYIGLVELARLKPFERVLIHTAAGGVGLSAVQIAKWIGAEIYATAGSSEKRDYLLKLGIEKAFDSRSVSFAEDIKNSAIEMDVVLNTLSGNLMTESMQLLRPFGRFIHLDKKDVASDYHLQLSLFVNSISFQFLDISLLFKNPLLMKKSLKNIVGLFTNEKVKPIKYRLFPAAELKQAVTRLSRGTHIGKMVIKYDEEIY